MSEIVPSSEPGDLLQAYACTQLVRAAHCLSRRGTRTHDGVHQARKSMRRVRACIALAGFERAGEGRRLDRAIASLCRSLSLLRDAHARVGLLDAMLHHSHPEDEQSLLRRARRAALADRVDAMRVARAEDPDFADRRRQLLVLGKDLTALPWTTVDADAITAAINHSLVRARKAQTRALNDGDADDWHRWRRRRRRLAQQHTALQAIGIESGELNDAEREITHLLGESQDLHVLVRYFGGHRAISKRERRALASLLHARHAHKNAEVIGRVDGPAA